MSDKSYVTLENKICQVCGKQHDHDCGVLLDRHMCERFERVTISGYGLCAECEANAKSGLTALIEADNSSAGSTLKPEEANRTGRIFWISPQLFKKVFRGDSVPPIAFIEPAVGDMLERITNE